MVWGVARLGHVYYVSGCMSGDPGFYRWEGLGPARRYHSSNACLSETQGVLEQICADSPKQEPAQPRKQKPSSPAILKNSTFNNPTSKAKKSFLIMVISARNPSLHPQLNIKINLPSIKIILYLLPIRNILIVPINILSWVRLNPYGLVITL